MKRTEFKNDSFFLIVASVVIPAFFFSPAGAQNNNAPKNFSKYSTPDHFRLDTVYPKERYFLKNGRKVFFDGLSQKKERTNSLDPQNPQGQHKISKVLGTISLTLTVVNTTCGYNRGSIIATPSGGTPPYTFTLGNYLPVNVGFFTDLFAGTYPLIVTDAGGDTTIENITISNDLPPPAVAVVTWTEPSFCDSANGSITYAASGGTPPYTYSLDDINFQSSPTFSNLPPGDYVVFVKDANGCVAESVQGDEGFLLEPRSFYCVGFGFGGSNWDCADHPGFVDVSVPVDEGLVLYSLDGINFQTIGHFENLDPGMHILYLKDTLGIVTEFSFLIENVCEVSLQATTIDASCKLNNGSITAVATNGAAPYSYTLDGIHFQPTGIFTGLAPGNYSIAVKDNTGIFSWLIVTVGTGCPTVTATANNANCGLDDGVITATGASGTQPYTFSIDGNNFQSGNIFTGLAPGKYTITIKDADGNTATIIDSVENICLNITAVPTNAICGNINGSILVSGSSGTPPYSFSINGISFQSSGLFTGLAPGNYTLTIKDATGVTNTTTTTINSIAGPTIGEVITPASCALNDGIITITATGGTAPIQYSIDGTDFQSSGIFSNIASGSSYTAVIKDANSCTATEPVTMTFNCLSVNAMARDATCGQSDGSIIVSGSSGTAPYLYSIDGINFQSGNLFSNLVPGMYTVTIKDATARTASTAVTVGNDCLALTLSLKSTTCGNSNGYIVVSASAGTAPYQYSVDGTNFQSNDTISDLSSGNYTITVKDATGIISTTSAAITNTSGPQLSATTTKATCAGNDGSITAIPAGGTAPFEYSIDNNVFQNNSIFTGIDTGAHVLSVKDSNGCQATLVINVPFENDLSVKTSHDTTICEGTTAFLSVYGNASKYSWSPASNLRDAGTANPLATPDTTTKYFVTASIGICSALDSVSVLVNSAPVPNPGIDTAVCFGKSVQLHGSGGSDFTWTPSIYLSDTSVADPIVSQPVSTVSYHLVVTGINGCRSVQNDSVIVTVTPPAKVFAGDDTAVVINQSVVLNAVDVNNSGFTNYTWSPPAGLDNPDISDPKALITGDIVYTVVATTPDGCEGADSISIKTYPFSDIFVPNAFTPNGDGINDLFRAIPVGVRTFKYLAVFNRYGQRVFYTTNSSLGWDGKFNGAMQDTNTFVWMVEGVDYSGNIIQKKGSVVLIR
jgi:gliding motility-associated-like protein